MAWLEHIVSTFAMFHVRSMQLVTHLCVLGDQDDQNRIFSEAAKKTCCRWETKVKFNLILGTDGLRLPTAL